jgi:hypothetical protein
MTLLLLHIQSLCCFSSDFIFLSRLGYGTTVTAAIYSTSRAKLLSILCVSRYYNIMPNMYVSVPSNLMDRPKDLICHLISHPISPAPPSIPFSSLLTQYGVYIQSKQDRQWTHNKTLWHNHVTSRTHKHDLITSNVSCFCYKITLQQQCIL